MAPAKFNPQTDIPDLSGKVIFITGGTAGLGAGSITALAKHNPAHIVFSGRNSKSANALIQKVRSETPTAELTFLECDLTSFASIQATAKKFTTLFNRLDIFMLNAGIMAIPAATTKDGYEIQFGVNHLGHALLLKHLLPTLLETAKLPGADVRVINMTSIAYKQAPSNGIDFATLKSPQTNLGGMVPGPKWSRYGQSKLAQLFYSQELARRYPQITSVSVHPGYIFTGLMDNVSMFTLLPVLVIAKLGRNETKVEEGPYMQLWAATCEKGKLVNGEYYEPFARVGKRATKASKDNELSKKLWDWTEQELKGF